MAATTLGSGALDADALKRANVNPETGLATDYLNHFNEAVMLIEMAADMPDLAEDILAWAPCGYEAHFERTHYTGKETAIAAWRAAPRPVRAHFETVIAALDEALGEAQTAVREGDFARAGQIAAEEVEPLLAAARACVNGRIEGEDVDDSHAAQAGVDALFS
ncbi:MAG: hypothetical protein ACLFQ5_04450 [Oceanicaulis sp.]